ncbi:uncharacterized protein PV09_06122 [Verruconis gallopava]|uniref:Cleavage/polyadenylation specificity factor A subunit N-terminal domain-containing protein n=1 Tax=Verruconis gallopava TaxID=253628 RepID=A0A0D2A7X5_9PEZI|nr:uncharacterized protein PV09_06122 [Verruconis gallopava]KIW02685.1 hypothetical protein PV09_06122 [Verruconis gallopava]
MAFELANGHGTTRLSIEQLLERERRLNSPDDNSVQRQRAPPGIGILSRTLIPSSMIKWIIPARFLHGANMQLLFVGENYIHIKEVIPDAKVDYCLRHRKTIPYINDHIRSVALLGRPRVSQLWREGSPMPGIVDLMFHSGVPEQEHPEFPIQVLVVALSSGFLQLLTPDLDSTTEGEYINFKSKLIPLPLPEYHASSPGFKIAVDPFSRAFAVVAPFDHVVVYNNYSSRDLAARIASNKDEWNPIRQERIFKIPGCIIAVEFLNPGETSNDVVMIIVSAVGRRHALSCFTWNHHDGPRYRAVVESKPLYLEPGSLCNMIIPMAHTPEFLLVHGSTINLFIDILSGSPRVMNIINKKSNWESEPAHPANSKRRPHFTAWSRPSRAPSHKGEFFFLIREDGAIRHYERTQGRTGPYGVVGNSGELGCHVGSAFASFNPRRNTPDYVIATGDMSPGEFASMGLNLVRNKNAESMTRHEQMELVKQATLPDWAPIMDLHVDEGNKGFGRSAILATTGRQPFGALSELRIGNEARISSIADLTQLDESFVGANGLWVLQDPAGELVHLVTSYPDRTTAVCLSTDGQLEESTITLENDRNTVFAAITLNGTIVLVTETNITLQRLTKDEEMDLEPNFKHYTSSSHITAAVCYGNFLVVASRQHSWSSHLEVFEVGQESCHLALHGEVAITSSEITALTMFQHGVDLYAIIATREPKLMILQLSEDGRPCNTPREQSSMVVDVHDLVVQSMQVLLKRYDNGIQPQLEKTVACGTRDGQLICVHLNTSAGIPRFGERESYRIGHGPVVVSSDTSSLDRAFVICDEEVISITHKEISSPVMLFTSIIFTDENDTSFQQKALAAIVTLPINETTNNPGFEITIACHDGQNLIFARLLFERRTLPRRLPLRKYMPSSIPDMPPHDISGTPTKLFYSKKLKANIVAGVKYEHRPHAKVPEPSWQGKRVTRGFLSIIPSHSNENVTPQEELWNEKMTQVDFAPSERILSACEWVFKRDGKTYEYLLAGTSIKKGKPIILNDGHKRDKTGRLWFFAARKSSNGTVKLELKGIKEIDQPVRALANLDETKVIVAHDHILSVYTLSTTNKWSRVCKKELRSTAVHITVVGLHIFVTTSINSTIAFAYEAKEVQGEEKFELVELLTDDVSRQGITHTVLDIQWRSVEPTASFPTTSQSQREKDDKVLSILLGSDKDGQIYALEIPKSRTWRRAASTIFELSVPQCVVKFTSANVRAPWYNRDTAVQGVLRDDIIGATADGTVYHFTILTDEARLLFKFLENLVRWNEVENQINILHLEQQSIGPRDTDMHTADSDEAVLAWPMQNVIIDPEFVPGAVGERKRRDQYGINGDLLDCFLGKNGRVNLCEMLNREGVANWKEESRYVGNQRHMKWKKFRELVQRHLGPVETTSEQDQEQMIDRCINWLEEVMRPVL